MRPLKLVERIATCQLPKAGQHAKICDFVTDTHQNVLSSPAHPGIWSTWVKDHDRGRAIVNRSRDEDQVSKAVAEMLRLF